jgi:hypothetical protein
MPVKKWKMEADERAKETVFQDTMDEFLEYYPDIGVLDELQRTYRAIKNDCSVDDIDYILNETSWYFSDRRVHLQNRTGWIEYPYKYKPARRNMRPPLHR